MNKPQKITAYWRPTCITCKPQPYDFVNKQSRSCVCVSILCLVKVLQFNMNTILVIVFFIMTWMSIYLTHTILTSCLVHPYLRFTQAIGLTVKPFFLRFYCTRVDNRLKLFTRDYEGKVRRWFDLGIITTFILMPVSIFLVFQTIASSLFLSRQNEGVSTTLYLLVPGVNLPFSQIFYFVINLLLSSVFHELGHLIAALREGIRVDGFGLMIFALVPMAFVEMDGNQLQKISFKARMRIFCGGVWHNVVLGVVAILAILLLPYFAAPLFVSGQGVSVISIANNWQAPTGYAIEEGDHIHGINHCPVRDKETWKECFQRFVDNYSRFEGYCVPNSFIQSEKIEVTLNQCCPEDSNRHHCFVDAHQNNLKYCLQVRETLLASEMPCNLTSTCSSENSCLLIHLENEKFRLMEFQRTNKPSFLFLGDPRAIYQSTTVINYTSKFNFLSTLPIYYFDTFLRYLSSFSLGLALINAMPGHMMDGKWISREIADFFLSQTLSKSSIDVIVRSFCTIGTAAIVLFTTTSISNIVQSTLF
ncbi:membrane-bound transcription factor site-2 protease isoform X2 [Brevipalpus obovatus]|uniref:membrane-bound transcription factor site-2 protease isoform X2 n=1 Tax=Brevipalpus obovatus TaxID=246614 RepID=UPI003D9EC763